MKKLLLLLLLLAWLKPIATYAQSSGAVDKIPPLCLTAIERVALDDELQKIPTLRKAYQEAQAATDACGVELNEEKRQHTSTRAEKTVAESKASKRGAENWLWRGGAVVLAVLAVVL